MYQNMFTGGLIYAYCRDLLYKLNFLPGVTGPEVPFYLCLVLGLFVFFFFFIPTVVKASFSHFIDFISLLQC